MSYIKNPSSIEEKSFQIIQSVIDQDHPGYEFHEDMEEAIIKRAIHTTGDFDYLYTMKFINHVNERIVDVIQNKGTIIVDSSISLNGINKRVLDQMGVSYRCLINDEDVIKLAKEKNITRAMATIEKATEIEGPKVFAFGGAPTALFHLLDLIKEKKVEVDAIIGVPVGFINVLESKEALLATDLPVMVNEGRKGGSTLVVAIINAIIYQMQTIVTEDYVRYSTALNDKKG